MSRAASSEFGTRPTGRPSAPHAVAAVAAGIILVLCGARSSAASLDDQVHAVARQLMCPVCQGQTVAESDSALAGEMKAIIRQKLQAGETPEQIVRYFVGQFGDGILAEPRPGGVSLILYAAPPLALIVGAGVVLVFLRRAAGRRGSRDEPPDAETVSP